MTIIRPLLVTIIHVYFSCELYAKSTYVPWPAHAMRCPGTNQCNASRLKCYDPDLTSWILLAWLCWGSSNSENQNSYDSMLVILSSVLDSKWIHV